jgi:uncharacterized DUF497 family protein
MYVEWDEAKHRSNRAKHGVRFELAARVFDDPYALGVPQRIVDHEERWQTIGLVDDMLVLLVAHTRQDDENNETIRIISARKATPHERSAYEQKRKSNPA